MSNDLSDAGLRFLHAIRTGWCNSDYIEFLVEKVWKIKEPVKIVDFGCGFGYVGLLLLPILPKGSSYTGIDINENYLNAARQNFARLDYQTDFIMADLNVYEPEECFDIAISQAVLRHIPQAKIVLGKMVKAVVHGGMVICMENDLEIEKAGQYFSGLDYTELGMSELHRKKYKRELVDGGRDYRFGAKVPMLMQEMGLHNVGVRMNDSIKFVNPFGDADDHDIQYDAMAKAWGWDIKTSEDDLMKCINELVNSGLTMDEAKRYMDGEKKIGEYVRSNRDNAYIIQATGTLISYGTK